MKLVIAGDFCPSNRVKSLFENNEYGKVLDDVKSVTCLADYSIVNLECPVILHASAQPIPKCGPNLSCGPYGVEALKYAGFDCVTLANNHFLDYGEAGVIDTIETLNKHTIDYVGGGMNLEEASKTLYKRINDEVLAIINCCEHEFSIATDNSAGSNPLDPIQIYYKIKKAKENSDYIIIIIHGGYEHFQLPSERMQDTYRFFIDAGADAVVNHHQHCFSGYEVYKEKPIFYGLGNFCFDNPLFKNSIWNESIILRLYLSNRAVDFDIVPIRQCSDEEMVSLLPYNAYCKKLEELNSIISDRHLLDVALQEYYRSCDSKYEDIFEPIQNRFYLGAKRRGWLKSMIGEKKRFVLENFILCESHREKIAHMFNNKKYKKQGK